MADSDEAMGSLIKQKLDDEFKKITKRTTEFFEERTQEIEKYERELRGKTENRLKDVEDKVTRDVRTRVFSIALTVVIVAAGAMLVGSFAATREVNNSVISLQNTIIATQNAIKDADKALTEQAKKLSDASNALTLKTTELDSAKSKLEDATREFNRVREELEKVRGELGKAQVEYQNMSKARP
jgi:predicted  nucleic acid-binding Zn-ribbon protein